MGVESRAPLEEVSVCRRDHYLTTQNIHTTADTHPPGGILSRNPSSERPQIHALEHADTRIGQT
jgi:hypothetical protein